MALKKEQKTVLTLAAVTTVSTVVLLQAMAPFMGIRKDPTPTIVTIAVVEVLLFAVAFWVAGKGKIG